MDFGYLIQRFQIINLEGITSENTASFQSLVSTLEDPRQQVKILYPLDEILLLCLCGVVSGCESFVDIVEYGAEKLKFLRRLADFKHGIPSHDVSVRCACSDVRRSALIVSTIDSGHLEVGYVGQEGPEETVLVG